MFVWWEPRPGLPNSLILLKETNIVLHTVTKNQENCETGKKIYCQINSPFFKHWNVRKYIVKIVVPFFSNLIATNQCSMICQIVLQYTWSWNTYLHMKWKCDYHGIYKGSLRNVKILQKGNGRIPKNFQTFLHFRGGRWLMILFYCEMQCNYPQNIAT